MHTLPPNRKKCSPKFKRVGINPLRCASKSPMGYAMPVDQYNPNMPFAPIGFAPSAPKKKSRKTSSTGPRKQRSCKYGRRHGGKCPTKSQKKALEIKVARSLQARYRRMVANRPKPYNPMVEELDDM